MNGEPGFRVNRIRLGERAFYASRGIARSLRGRAIKRVNHAAHPPLGDDGIKTRRENFHLKKLTLQRNTQAFLITRTNLGLTSGCIKARC